MTGPWGRKKRDPAYGIFDSAIFCSGVTVIFVFSLSYFSWAILVILVILAVLLFCSFTILLFWRIPLSFELVSYSLV